MYSTEDDTSSKKTEEDIKKMVQHIISEFKIPGMSVGIIKDDKVILNEGFGTTGGEGTSKVDGDTNFFIGTLTKAFTSLLTGQLIDEKKIKPYGFDTPIRYVLCDDESFKDLGDVSFRDLLAHRTGQPHFGHDLAAMCSGFKRSELLERLPFAEKAVPLRVRLLYSNLMVMAAGELISRIAGESSKCAKDSKTMWEDLVKSRIFDKLGMERTFVDPKLAKQSKNIATPFMTQLDKTLKKVTVEDVGTLLDVIGPAGKIISNNRDMLKWIKLHLNGGKLGSKTLISNETLLDMQLVSMPLSLAGYSPLLNHNLYHRFHSKTAKEDITIDIEGFGLGWIVENYRGYRTLWHTGFAPGTSTHISLIPDANVGIVVMGNRDHVNLVLQLLTYYITDITLGMKPWLAPKTLMHASEFLAEPVEWMTPQPPMVDDEGKSDLPYSAKSYSGTYKHPFYGTVEVSEDGTDSFKFVWGPVDLKLSHVKSNVFKGKGKLGVVPFGMYTLFSGNFKGEIDRFSIIVDPHLKPVVFTKDSVMRVGEVYNNKILEETCFESD